MLALISTLCSWLACRIFSRTELELELIALRHQVAVLNRQRPGRLRLCSVDRLVWVWLYRVWPRCLETMVLVKPATVVQWHRQGFRLYWRWRSQSGRRPIAGETRKLIREMCIANPLWGAPRIHASCLSSASRSAKRPLPSTCCSDRTPHRRVGAASCATRHSASLPSTCSSCLRQPSGCFVMLILAHDRRKIVRFDVTQHPTAGWLSRQVTEAFPWDRSSLSAARSRRFLWRGIQQAGRSDADHRGHDGGTFTLAESLYRESHRLDPARVSRPLHHLQRAPFASRPLLLRALLPQNTDPFVPKERLS